MTQVDPLPTPLDVIAVGAHPDDVEIACGGTLAKLSRQGYRVGIIDLTDGEPTPNSPGPLIRLEEARAAARRWACTSESSWTCPTAACLTVSNTGSPWRRSFVDGGPDW